MKVLDLKNHLDTLCTMGYSDAEVDLDIMTTPCTSTTAELEMISTMNGKVYLRAVRKDKSHYNGMIAIRDLREQFPRKAYYRVVIDPKAGSRTLIEREAGGYEYITELYLDSSKYSSVLTHTDKGMVYCAVIGRDNRISILMHCKPTESFNILLEAISNNPEESV